MSLGDYFLIAENWSSGWAIFLFVLLGSWWIWLKPSRPKTFSMITGLILIYLVIGGPLSNLTEFGLHSAAMLQHVIILMLAPLFIWVALPGKIDRTVRPQENNSGIYILLAWIAGTITMWAAHFISAGKIASESGLTICGMPPNTGVWYTEIPNTLLLLLLFAGGMLFISPVFNRKPAYRLKPLRAVIYLFTACISCSLLGLWVAFSAASASTVEAATFLTTLRSPLPMSIRADQELAGMIMWVPGCVLYVATSAHIALEWLEGRKTKEELNKLDKDRRLIFRKEGSKSN